jgi:hypothetical protein
MAAANDPLKYWFDDLTSSNGKCCSFADDEMLKDASRRRFDVVIAWIAASELRGSAAQKGEIVQTADAGQQSKRGSPPIGE